MAVTESQTTKADYENKITRMQLVEEERKLVEDWPGPIAFGYLKARRQEMGVAVFPKASFDLFGLFGK